MTAALSFLAVAVAAAVHLRRLVVTPPLHLLADEQATYRNVSVLTLGLMLTAAMTAPVSPLVWATIAVAVAITGARIGSRLHLARPMLARLACIPLPDGPEIDDSATLACASGGTHEVPDPVAILMTPRTMSRTALAALPYTLIGGAHEPHIPAAVAFLRAARDCGCLTFVAEDEPVGTDSRDDTDTAPSTREDAA